MITGTMKLKEILEHYPESFEVFRSNGFDYEQPEDFLKVAGPDTMLRTLLYVRGINQELFLYYLDNAVLKAEAERQHLLEDFVPGEKLDFYGNTICPLKFTFRDALEEIEREHKKQHGFSRKCYLEFGKMTDDTCGEAWDHGDPEKFPGVFFSKEFNEYLSLDFQKKMEGRFTGDFYEKVNPVLKEAGLYDPENIYNVYGVMAETFLIDKKRLGDLPVPRTLEALLDPMYENNIIIFGKDRETISNALFLYIYKAYGEEGIRKFAGNVKHALHGSVMSKTAASSRSEGGAIYLVSWFFAQTCVREGVEIVWPDDGAITLPMYMLVRKDDAERVKDITDYITGKDFAEACTKAYTPPMNGEVNANLPPGAAFQWLGWDFIRSHDIPTLAEHCLEVFWQEWQRLHPGGVLCP
ncbi:ABC transporter substrate-binding protein [Lacrimispora sp.]|uniref:ABC transporter substrate-binding protein n=1 Tax=Lacrimispora sp. TaxID=2719234 RepID=UPI002FD9424D